MDVATFYALFSATCFTLLGLWWSVVQRHEDWMRDAARRRVVGGIYLAFLLPAVMGLFAQVGGTEQPIIWRTSFVLIALIGGASTFGLLRAQRQVSVLAGPLMRHQWVVIVIYGVVAVFGLAPELAQPLGLIPVQAEAILLILLVVMAHGLVWEFMIGAAEPAADDSNWDDSNWDDSTGDDSSNWDDSSSWDDPDWEDRNRRSDRPPTDPEY